ncbi:MAG: DUF2797 domain-containing protein [Proteobacteria bacterium]|nr:DUF2797 domain-containing protein [Pseudomonadota bacterium]
MKAELKQSVEYFLPVGDELVAMNPLIGNKVRIEYQGAIHCVSCGRKTNKSFSQGHCFPCMRSLASCDICIMKPEQCHHAEGTCREPQWAEDNCMQPHVVYVANSSGLKVGITRHTQIPTRWIDQGAAQAIPLLQTSQRYYSGLVEVALKAHMNDKTDWRRMLKGEPEAVDMVAERKRALVLAEEIIADMHKKYGEQSVTVPTSVEAVTLSFPVERYPEKVKAHNFDKDTLVEGLLQGIKGQYLIFDTGVLNIRKFGGYQINIIY